MSRLIGKGLRNGYEAFVRWRKYSNSRKQADWIRGKIIANKSSEFVDKKKIKLMKDYSDDRYGDPGHWHWLAVYSEIREEFIEGWLPNDIYTYKLIPYLNPLRFSYLSTLKSYDHHVFERFAATPVAVFINGAFYDAHQNHLKEHEFLQKMKHYSSEVVIKEDGAPMGEGIRFIHSGAVTTDDFDERISYVIQPLFKQHPELAKAYEESVNTVRISTCLNLQGRVDVKHLLLRLGRGKSRIVNAGVDDIDLYIDIDGNVLKNAVDGIGRVHGDCHPDTLVKYKDLKVPAVKEAIKVVKKAHLKFPYLRFIGWDLYIDEDKVPRMIEWNTVSPRMWVHEAHIGPLWSKEEIDEAMGTESEGEME